MSINWSLKEALVQKYGSQVVAARQMGIRESRLSYIIRGHIVPTERERQALERSLGHKVARRLLRR